MSISVPPQKPCFIVMPLICALLPLFTTLGVFSFIQWLTALAYSIQYRICCFKTVLQLMGLMHEAMSERQSEKGLATEQYSQWKLA